MYSFFSVVCLQEKENTTTCRKWAKAQERGKIKIKERDEIGPYGKRYEQGDKQIGALEIHQEFKTVRKTLFLFYKYIKN